MVVLVDRDRYEKADIFWLDGYIADIKKTDQASRHFAGERANQLPELQSHLDADFTLEGFVGWLGQQPGTAAFYLDFQNRSMSDQYPVVKREEEGDSELGLYRAIITVRTDKQGIGYRHRRVGKLTDLKEYDDLFTMWGLRIKAPEEYHDHGGFEAEVKRLLIATSDPYRMAWKKATTVIQEAFPFPRKYEVDRWSNLPL